MTEEKRVTPEPAAQAAGRDAIYELDGRISVQKAVPFGLQHVLAMFVANIAPILIVAGVAHLGTEETGSLVQTAMIIAGIGSLLQMFPIGPLGSRLPIVMGISFTFVSTFCVIGANSFGGGFGNPHFGEAKYLIVGTITLVACLVFHIRAHGFYKQLSVLFGLVAGYVAAYFFGMVDLSKIGSAGLFSLPHFLPYPMEFRPDAIFSVFLIFLVSATETLGDTSALSVMGMGRLVRDKEVSGSIAVDGFISALSSLFGCLPITSFSQNVGLVAMTHVVNRKAIASGAVLMILAGLIPALGVILASLPDAVLGGCTLMMFGSIVVSGVRMLGDCGFSSRNMSIAALSLSIGIGFTQAPAIFKIFPTLIQSVFAENCVAVVFLVAFLLNLVFPSEEALQREEWEREAKQKQEQAR
ncbi:MAG: solute carrier family 23 protein [Succiniclasticum sp.]|nr:solute carrier family 23 protein [Succiniclasticum sp.]